MKSASAIEILDQAKVSVVVSPERYKVNIQNVAIIFGPRKSSKSILTFSNVHIVATSESVQASNSDVSHEVSSLR